MTTIVADRARMVSDSKVTMERKAPIPNTPFASPKLYIGKGWIIGAAGYSGDGEKFVKWFKSKRRKSIQLDDDFEALVVTPEGLFFVDGDCSLNEVKDPWYAIGSGSAAALGALHAGATLERAVEIACVVDNGSGLPLQVAALGMGDV